MSNNIIADVINLVHASERKMPAHFTSNDERKQTFLIDFDQLTADDEYEMASEAWYKQPDVPADIERYACVKIGEDVMVACYILSKLGQKEHADYLTSEIIHFEILQFPENMHDTLQALSETKGVHDYFEFCKSFGLERAGSGLQ